MSNIKARLYDVFNYEQAELLVEILAEMQSSISEKVRNKVKQGPVQKLAHAWINGPMKDGAQVSGTVLREFSRAWRNQLEIMRNDPDLGQMVLDHIGVQVTVGASGGKLFRKVEFIDENN